MSQLGLITEAATVGPSGYRPIVELLRWIDRSLAATTSPMVDYIIRIWSGLYDCSGGAPAVRAALRGFGTRYFLPILERLGWSPDEQEPANVSSLRSTLVDALGGAMIPEVVEEARRRFLADAVDPNAIPPSLRAVILQVVARNADQRIWDRLHEVARHATSVQRRRTLYSLLGTARASYLQKEAVGLAFTAEPGPSISLSMIEAVGATDAGEALDAAINHMARV